MSQISFTISNGSAGNTIYAPTTEPAVNKIALLISSDATLTLTAGEPVEEKQAATATNSLFYLHVKNLELSEGELNGLSVSLPGWNAKVFANTQVICLTPAENSVLSQGQVLNVTIDNFISSSAPGGSTAQLYMNFYRASPVSTGRLPFTYNNIVSLQAPPSGKLDFHEVIAVTLDNNSIVQSTSDFPGVRNSFNLTLGPGPHSKTVTAGPKTALTVSFVYASDQYGYGALSTVANALNFGVNQGDGASAWLITPPAPSSASPAWSLQPPNGQPILGAGSAVSFAFSTIATQFQAGATLMLISYTDVPGYQDGVFPIILFKEAHVYIHSLLAAPNPAVLNNGSAEVDLSWNASAKRLTLMPGMIDVTDLSTYSAEIRKSTQFTLVAQGRSANNYASEDIQVDILPVINSIVASPQNVYYKDFPHDVLLDWSVNTDNEVALSNSVNNNVQLLPPTYTAAVNISQPQMFTIRPNNQYLPLFIERSEVISAYELQQRSVSLNSAALAVALSPVANICALVKEGSDQIIILETITNSPYGNPINAGSKPGAMVFSHDGTRLFVANQGDSTLSIFSVAFNEASSYKFSKLADLNLSGSPVALDISADDTAVFVTSNNSNSTPGALDVITKDGAGNYVVSGGVTFPDQVGTLAVLPSAAQIFVLCPSQQQIFVVGYDNIQQSYQLVRTIEGFSASDKPADLAIAGQDAGTLLIVCSGSNSVYAVNKEVSNVAGYQKLTVGSKPARIKVIESGAYAYVANSGDQTLSLIGCFKGSGLSTVLEKSLANGAAPVALSTSANGSVIYVANKASNLSIWSIKTFTNDGTSRSATLTTSVAASRRYVVSWHNFNINITYQGKTATAGLSVYDRITQTYALVNSATKYTTFQFWPDETQNIGIATVYGDTNLYVLNTKKFTTSATVPLSSSPTCRAVSTTISQFGNIIFVLTVDSGAYKLVAISCDLKANSYKVVSTVELFTQTAASSHSLAAVSDGSLAFVTDSVLKKLYIVSGKDGVYKLESKSYDFAFLPKAMSCAPDDSELYVWMNQNNDAAFARFDIGTRTLENFILPNTVSFQVTGMAIAPDGARLFVVDTNMGVRVFSTASMQNTENISLPGATFPYGIAVTPDGSGLYTANVFSDNVSLLSQLAASPAQRELVDEQALPGVGNEYQGIFIRDYIGQTPTSNVGSGWTMSPDIAPYGTTPMKDPSVLGQQANYNIEYANNIALGQYNFVYVRGLNTVSGPQKSRIYFYQVDSSIILLPSQWSPYNFAFDQNLQNWLDVSAQNKGDIAYSPAPLSWKPSAAFPHYCLVVWVDNSKNPSPPDLAQFANFKTWDDLGRFILSHPNMGWRNTNDVAAAGQFMNAQTRVTGVAEGGAVTVGVIMKNIPTDGKGTIQFTLVNSNGTISYTSPVHPIDTNTFSQTINWPANVPDPILTYTYNPLGGKLAGDEQITAFTSYVPPLAMLKQLLLRAPHLLLGVPVTEPGGIVRFGGVVQMLLGTVRFNYKPSK